MKNTSWALSEAKTVCDGSSSSSSSRYADTLHTCLLTRMHIMYIISYVDIDENAKHNELQPIPFIMIIFCFCQKFDM